MKRIAGIVVAALMVCLFAVGCASEPASTDNAITVSASAKAPVTPDRATIGFTIAASADSQDAAIAAGEKAASEAAARLRTLGIRDENIATGAVTTVERYGESGVAYETYGYEDEYGNWIEEVHEYYYDTSGEVVGYDAAVHMQVSDFDFDRFGQVIREATGAGATGFDGLVMSVSDRNATYQEALAKAVDAAKAKAESLAKASGVYVGRVVNMVENSTVPAEVLVEGDAGAIKVSDPSTFDIVPGEAEVEASVTVSYAIS